MWEVFVQCGPVVNVYVPKDRVTNAHQGYAFVEYRGEDDADYVSGPAHFYLHFPLSIAPLTTPV